jgi:hypothetical protein
MASSSRGVAVDLEGTDFCFVGITNCLELNKVLELAFRENRVASGGYPS